MNYSFPQSLEGMHSLAQKCMQLKPNSNSSGLMGILLGILGGNTEVDYTLSISVPINALIPWTMRTQYRFTT